MQERRAFVFLQGPPGPLFRRLGTAMAARGIEVYRINISGGDRYDWPEGAIDYRGRFADWPVFFDAFLREHQITDLILFGDCRPYHVSAHGMAARRGVRTHVLEEGYLRPDWMTFELEGVNARSTLSRDKIWFRQEAMRLPPEPQLPQITASFRRRARDAYCHYHHVLNGRFRYRHYRSHRSGSILMEGFGWLWRFARSSRRLKAADETLRTIQDKPLFILALQLSGDFQIRAHSPFPDMKSAASYVIASFAAHAEPDCHLLVKAHPLDCSFFNWRRFIGLQARRHGLVGRIHFIDGGDLESLMNSARGFVCVNSTSATLALAAGIPVCTIGAAIYDMPGLTHQGHVDQFWRMPTPPERGLYPAFRRVLLARCLVRGGLASESAVTTLIQSILDRLDLKGASTASSPLHRDAPSRSEVGSWPYAEAARREPRSPAAHNR